jgi:hypothetical protein
MLVYFCCLDLQLLGETVREIVYFCSVIEEYFARMRVDESFGHNEPKMGVSNADEREVLRRWEVATVSGGDGPIAGTSRGVLGGRTSFALRFLGTLVPCVLSLYNEGKVLLSCTFRVLRG